MGDERGKVSRFQSFKVSELRPLERHFWAVVGFEGLDKA